MFNHQNQGGMNPQMLQMQRFMANRPQRTSAFMAQNGDMQMNTPAELNDRRFPMGWAQQQQRNFPLAPPHNLMGFPAAAGRPEFNNFGMLANPMAGSSSAGMGQMGESSNFIGNSSVRLPFFKCPECNIVKNSGEDLEVHTKTEHLNWLPFICPLCHAGRASDIQMREHMYSFHKKNENKYIYHDNPQAKKILQEMMDKALFGASNQFQQMKRRSTFFDTKNAAQPTDSTKRARLDEVEEELKGAANKKPGEETSKKQQNTSETGNLSEGNAGSIGGGQERQQSIDEETDAQLNAIFGRRNIKSEFDDLSALDGTPSPHLSMNDELGDDNSHTLDALQNVAAMFSASGGSIRQQGTGRNRNSSGLFRQQKRIVRNRPGPMTSKKRVLGECGRCHKPITAGARQMHMFFHLGKDKKTFRFRCKHPGCPVEHYRKDQMENHQSKVHGQVDPNMMDDRTQELYNMVQKLSMELLGTVGNTPGPTAAKAQLLYDQQMREMHDNVGPRKRNSNGNGGIRMFDSANRKIEDLECKICNKTIMSRIRGFHILWHLNNDLGIVRYGCKFCNFKHDRPQSVVAHGSRDHGVQNCCDDLLYNFEDELKSMSKACFGVERLFEKEIRRRIKMEQGGDSEQSPKQEEDEEEDSQTGSCSYARMHRSAAQIAILKVPLKAENSDRSWATTSTPKDQVKKRRSIRRFGTRTKSRRQKAEMIKLREVSMRLGGAQYFKKKTNEAVPCEKCGKLITNRLSDHAYTHLDGCDLFRCQQCNLGHYSRETIVRHLRDFHNTNNEPPLDNRLRYAQEIKDAIRDCYPTLFVDAPIPMKEDIEKLKSNLKLENMVVDDDDEEKEEAKEEDEEGEEGNEEEEEEEANGEMETTGNDESGLNEEEEEMIFMEEELERGEEEEGHEDYDEEEEEGMEGEEGGEDDDEEEEEKEQKGKGGNKVEENE